MWTVQSRMPTPGSIVEPASTFVPRWLARRLVAGDLAVLPRAFTAHGAALFVDLVGFTVLTERYASAGLEGAEQLRTVLDEYFGGILEEVDAWGGDATAFAGDAVLVAFFDDDFGGPVGALAAAVACARAVQARPAAGLKQRVSIGIGELAMWALQGEGNRGIAVLGGAAVAQLAVPHGAANPGDIVLSAAARALASLAGTERAGGTLLLAPEAAPPRPRRRVPTPALLDAASLRPWLPRVILERGDARQGAWVDEFRTATVLFVALPVAPGSVIDPAVLQREVRQRVDVLAHFEGDCLAVVMDEKGATLIGAFGFPGRAHGDDAARAVRAAVAMQEGGASSTGVATGRLFAGLLGAPQRRDYGGLGPTMNLAARLMGKADGGVLVDEVTRRRCGADGDRRVAFETAGSVQVKGFAEPVAVFTPVASGARVDAAEPMLGRAVERAGLLAELDRGALRVVVVGEPGIGKSSLLAGVMADARARGVRVLYGEGGAIERSTPWHAWKAVLAALVQGRSTADVLARIGDPDLAMRASLLDGLWPISVPSDPVVSQMESAARAAAIRAIVVRLLADALSAQPRASLAPMMPRRNRILLVLDDVHWLDSASAGLAREVLARLPGIDVLIGTRPLAATAPIELVRLVDGEGLSKVSLGAMSEAEVGELVGRALGVKDVPAALVGFVHGRSGGHPFYSEQLALALRDAHVVRVTDDGDGPTCTFDTSGAVGTLPATVEGVVTARIDALAPGAQLTAKVASVIGRIFPERSVEAIYPVREDAGELPQWLGQLSAQELILPEAGTSWGFKHAITQEVAYNLLLFAQRRDLHRRAAEWYRASPDLQWPTLAWHWEHAGDVAEATDSLEHAATDAFREHANTEGLGFLARAKALICAPGAPGGNPQVGAARLAHWETMSGIARLKLVGYPEAHGHFRAALAHLGNPVPSSPAGLGIGLLIGCLGLTRRLLFGVRRPDEQAERQRLRAVAEAHQGLAEVAYFSLDLPGLLHADVHAINAAERAGEPREIAIACASGAIGAGLGGLHRLGWRWNAQALEAAQDSKHLPTIAYVNLLSSVFTNTVGHCEDAAKTNAAATALFLQLGDAFRAASSLCGEGFACYLRGDPQGAARMSAQARALAPREGALQVRVWCAAIDLLVALLAGRGLDSAVAELDAQLAEEPQHGERILAMGLLSEARRAMGDSAQALALAREVGRLSAVAPPNNWFHVWPLAAAAETIRAARSAPGAVASDTDADLKRALKTMRTFAGMCVVGQARAALAEAPSMSASRGRRHVEAALSRAQALGMPLDVALCQRALGRAEGDVGIAGLQERARGAVAG